MPRAESSRPGQAALGYGDIPGVPTANWGTGESCVESELKRSRVPLSCVFVLLLIVLLGRAGDESPQPTPTHKPFASCKGLAMDCHGAETCGVVVLETGMGTGHYQHEHPSVHGLWPQTRPHGNSACVPAQNSTTLSAFIPPCYNNDEAQGDLAHQQDFVEHEWTKHGKCSGTHTL